VPRLEKPPAVSRPRLEKTLPIPNKREYLGLGTFFQMLISEMRKKTFTAIEPAHDVVR
jgi:hypothetical protein